MVHFNGSIQSYSWKYNNHLLLLSYGNVNNAIIRFTLCFVGGNRRRQQEEATIQDSFLLLNLILVPILICPRMTDV